MLRFKQHIDLQEATKPKIKGEEFENVICVAYNMMSSGVDKKNAIKLAETVWKTKYDPWLEIGKEIVKNSFSDKPTGIMKHFGSGSAELSTEWDAFFIKITGKKAKGPTLTPKTDMYLTNKNISLKKYGGSQLMSGGKSEAIATFALAYDMVPNNIKTESLDNSWAKFSSDVEKNFVNFNLNPRGQEGDTITSYKKLIKSGVKNTAVDFIVKQLETQSIMTKSIEDIMKTSEIKFQVVKEAMTGNQKFSKDTPKASYIMKFDERGRSENIKIDDTYISKVSNKTNFNVSFKSTTGGTARSALKALYTESADLAWESTTELLEEGLFDVVKMGIKKSLEFIKNIFIKMLSFVWKKLKPLLLSSVDNIQSILGLKLNVNSPNVVF